MATLESPTTPVGSEPPAPRSAAARPLRLVAMTAYALAAITWATQVGIPTDPISVFVWLWLGAIAWRWGQPLRRHLDFARDWWPALATLLFYTYTRGLADGMGIAPHVRMPIVVDNWLGFGQLPTQRLQGWLCGSTCGDDTGARWYDSVFTLTYASHFVTALIIAIVLWLRSRDRWVMWMRRYLALNLAGLSIYVLYPMVPPWMASQEGAFTPSIERMTGRGGSIPGFHMAQLVMGPIGNPVAAMPSLHAGTSCLVAFYLFTLVRSRLRYLLLLYPMVMTTALVYFGEHYVIDAIAGAVLAGLVLRGCTLWERWRSRPQRTEGDRQRELSRPAPAP